MANLRPIGDLRIVGRPLIGMKPPTPKQHSLSELEADNPRVIAALREVSRRLSARNVRHLVVGAVAVGAHGWPRATRDVDLLLGPEAWATQSDGTQHALVPLDESVDGVSVDYLPVDIAGGFLLLAFDRALVSEGVPIAPIEVVIVTKLIRHAMRDRADIVELLKARTFDWNEVEVYLAEHAPMLVPRFEALVEQAEQELAD
jgi:hypothetical protein